MTKQVVLKKRRRISELRTRYMLEWEPDPHRGAGEVFARMKSRSWAFSVRLDRARGGVRDMPIAVNYEGFSEPCHWLVTRVVSTARSSIAPDVATVEERFAALADRWHDETGFLSSPSRITSNQSYLKILSMGKRVIAMILEDLRERGGLWYPALRMLSEEDPVLIEARGDVEQMKEAWLQWGRDRGYIK